MKPIKGQNCLEKEWLPVFGHPCTSISSFLISRNLIFLTLSLNPHFSPAFGNLSTRRGWFLECVLNPTSVSALDLGLHLTLQNTSQIWVEEPVEETGPVPSMPRPTHLAARE